MITLPSSIFRCEVDTMMMDPLPKRPLVGGISQSHRDVTDNRYRELRRPRKVKFFCNGDRYFKGKKVQFTPHRYLSFNDLLNDLTEKLLNKVQLPYGVRQIFTPVSGKRIHDIEELQDGETYVCAGFESFKPVHYGREEVPTWSTGEVEDLLLSLYHYPQIHVPQKVFDVS